MIETDTRRSTRAGFDSDRTMQGWEQRLTWIGKTIWPALGLIVILAAIITYLAPQEQTLGQGIKSVYIHVAFIWSGMLGLIVAAGLGLFIAVTGRTRLEPWAQSLSWVSLLFYGAGLVMSVVAAGVNWGAVFWQEPRTNAALQVMAIGVIVQGLNTMPLPGRVKGALRAAPAMLMFWITWRTPLVLHPDNAARTSSSAAIRFTFLSLSLLCSMALAWLTVYLTTKATRRRPISDTHRP